MIARGTIGTTPTHNTQLTHPTDGLQFRDDAPFRLREPVMSHAPDKIEQPMHCLQLASSQRLVPEPQSAVSIYSIATSLIFHIACGQ